MGIEHGVAIGSLIVLAIGITNIRINGKADRSAFNLLVKMVRDQHGEVMDRLNDLRDK